MRGLVSLGFIAVCTAHAGPPPDQEASTRQKALQFFSASPAAFIENTGQIDDPSIRYAFHGSGANVYHTTSGPVFQVFQRVGMDAANVGADLPNLRGNRPPSASAQSPKPIAQSLLFSAAFPGARQIKPVGRQVLETKINYCLGSDHSKWQMGVPTFGVVVYEGLYDGIDLHTYGRRSNLKYEFHVAPGADWRQIRIRYSGIAGLSLAKDGSLIVNVGDGWGSLTDDAPIIYQEIAGKRTELPGRFVLVDERTYAFEIDGQVKADAPLVIDPELAWSTYLGGSGEDQGCGVAVDASGNVVVAGYTKSSGWISGGFDASYNGGVNDGDAFVAKLSPSGAHLWSTYLGGVSYDYGRGVAVDASGNVVVTGYTQSHGWVYDGFDTSFNGNVDAFLAKLSPSGAHLWSTYLGGNHDDYGRGVAVDASGNVLVTGLTLSSGWVSGGFDTGLTGYDDAFVAKISPSGAHLWSTYLGGSSEDWGYGVAVDAAGNVVVTGYTYSSSMLPADAFVAKLSPSGAHLWTTDLGGGGDDHGYGVAVDPSGNVLVTGYTYSSGWVSGGFDTSHNGHYDAFVAKLSPSGAPLWSTYLGGSGADYG